MRDIVKNREAVRRFQKNNLERVHGWQKAYRQSEQGKATRQAYVNLETSKQKQKFWNLKYVLRTRDGLPEEEINKALAAWRVFDSVCQCCGRSECGGRWCTDHDHNTKKFRGIIGHNCNVALGFIEDNPSLLKKLMSYLEGRAQ